MRTSSLATALFALLSLAACQNKSAAKDDLATDLARASASGSNTLTLAPRGNTATTVVSPEEQIKQPVHIAPSTPSMPYRAPHVDVQAPPSPVTSTASVANSTPVAPVVAPSAPAPAPQTAAAHQPQTISYPDPASAGRGDTPEMGSGRGPSPEGTRAVIRGGVVDGDHCDPRHDGKGPMAIGRNFP